MPRDDATALQGKGTHRGQRPSHKCGVGGARHSATDSFRGKHREQCDRGTHRYFDMFCNFVFNSCNDFCCTRNKDGDEHEQMVGNTHTKTKEDQTNPTHQEGRRAGEGGTGTCPGRGAGEDGGEGSDECRGDGRGSDVGRVVCCLGLLSNAAADFVEATLAHEPATRAQSDLDPVLPTHVAGDDPLF